MGRTVGLLRMSEHPANAGTSCRGSSGRSPRLGADEIVLETGYGQGLGLAPEAYTSEGDVRFAERDEVFAQDVVLVLRCPPDADLGKLRPGSTLVSMLHYVTRPTRNELLRDRGVVAVSLDAVTDDRGPPHDREPRDHRVGRGRGGLPGAGAAVGRRSTNPAARRSA